MFGPLKFSQSTEHSSTLFPFDFRQDTPTTCLLCDSAFILPSSQDEFCTHLFSEHKLVIADIHHIASLKSYVDYWRFRFTSNSITQFCSVIWINSKPDETTVNRDEYYLLSDVIQEDKLLREGLQSKRLDWVLEEQAKERDTPLSRTCLFCKQQYDGLRAEYFDHLTNKHNLHLGLPNNLVFTNELLDLIEYKATRLICLFCEGLFKDRFALKEHMRKKQHKRINPDNKCFDRFFVINYLEMGKTWQQVQEEPEDLESPEETSDWSDWNDPAGLEPYVVCLYCEQSYPSFEKVLEHMITLHKFNYEEICKTSNLDFYQQVKLVNYIRREIYFCRCVNCNEKFASRDDLLKHMAENQHFLIPNAHSWDQPEYYFPTYENDSFLCHLDDTKDDVDEDQLCKSIDRCRVTEIDVYKELRD